MTIAEHQQRSRQSTILVFILLTLAATRFIMGEFLRYYFISESGYDDQLMLTYSHITNHFRNPNYLSLVKTMSFPLFLNLIHKLHISFAQAVSLVWISAALLFYRLIRYLFKNRIFSCVAFAYILFHPVGYNAAAGVRIYRNTLIAPFVMMTFCELLMLFFHLINKDERFRVQILRSVIFSILLLFTYFIKEDGVWLSACTCFFILLLLLEIIVRFCKKRTMKEQALSAAVCAVLPLVIFFAGKQSYKAINQHYFQVAEIQTRTEGELGEFVSNAYKIESPEQNYQYTVPASSIKEMYRVSPTFQDYPELMNSILHSNLYGGDIKKNPIQGDFLTWVLRSALIETNTWKSEKQVSDLFAQINADRKQLTLDILEQEKYLCAAKLRMEQDLPNYSDANFTMRMTYGQVGEYTLGGRPSGYYTTARSLWEKMQKADENFEYFAEPVMHELLSSKDYGKYADKLTGTLQLCFLSNNDITGGNSGSPIFNNKGELLGLAFDGNWDSLSSDIFFDRQLARTINVDVRFMLYMMDKWGHADRLLQEMDIQ